jgi:hypothetical protein
MAAAYASVGHAYSFVMVVLGTTIHEFVCSDPVCLWKLVDGRTKSDHDETLMASGATATRPRTG